MKRLFFNVSGTIIVMLAIYACEEDSLPVNTSPQIIDVNLSTSDITPGGVIELSAIATDPDGDDLIYLWSSRDGFVDHPNSSTSLWTISMSSKVGQSVSINLIVSDGRATTSVDYYVNVIEGVTIQGVVQFSGTTIPIPGVKISVGNKSTTSALDGTYSIKNAPMGRVIIKAEKEGYDNFEKTEDFTAKTNDYNIPIISSSNTKSLYGRVLTVDNIPIYGVKVMILNPDNTESGLFDITDAFGQYRIVAVPQGNRIVKLTNFSYPSKLKDVTHTPFMGSFDKEYNMFIKMERSIDLLNSASTWEISGSGSVSSFSYANGCTLSSQSSDTFFRIKSCLTIPNNAEDKNVELVHDYNRDNRIYLTECLNWPITTSVGLVGYYWPFSWTGFTTSKFPLDELNKQADQIVFKTSSNWRVKALKVSYYY